MMPSDEAKSPDRPREPRMRTRLIHGLGTSKKWDYDHHVVPPITSSATFRLGSAARGALGFQEFANIAAEEAEPHPIYIYDRLAEPTRGMLEENLAYAERGEFGLCFASGMAAISATIATLAKTGENIVAHKVLYGCTYSLFTLWLPRLQMGVKLVDMTDLDALRAAIDQQTRVVYFETPVNPDLTLIDIAGVRVVVDEANRGRADGGRADAVRAGGGRAKAGRPEAEKVRIVVDNTFATPFCQRPIELGADVSCTSLTKGIGGFGTDIGGAVVGPKWLHDSLIMYRKDWGGSLSPKAAWGCLVYGLPSLATRMSQAQSSAHHIARFLAGHPAVAQVRYPGLDGFPQHELAKRQMRDEQGHFAPGAMIYFELKQPGRDGEAGVRLADWIAKNSYCITLAVSLGQVKTLIECPYFMTHCAVPAEVKRERGLTPGGMRLSVGLEDWQDIVADLEAALAALGE